MPEATMAEVFKWFALDSQRGYTMQQFRTDWGALTAEDKAELKALVGAEIG